MPDQSPAAGEALPPSPLVSPPIESSTSEVNVTGFAAVPLASRVPLTWSPSPEQQPNCVPKPVPLTVVPAARVAVTPLSMRSPGMPLESVGDLRASRLRWRETCWCGRRERPRRRSRRTRCRPSQTCIPPSWSSALPWSRAQRATGQRRRRRSTRIVGRGALARHRCHATREQGPTSLLVTENVASISRNGGRDEPQRGSDPATPTRQTRRRCRSSRRHREGCRAVAVGVAADRVVRQEVNVTGLAAVPLATKEPCTTSALLRQHVPLTMSEPLTVVPADRVAVTPSSTRRPAHSLGAGLPKPRPSIASPVAGKVLVLST